MIVLSQAEDASFFKLKDLNSQAVSVVLAKSLENLVDGENPQNVLKFRLVCDFEDGEDTVSHRRALPTATSPR